MSQNDVDPVADTDKFRAFVESQHDSAGPPPRRSNAIIVGVTVVLLALILAVAVVWFVVGG